MWHINWVKAYIINKKQKIEEIWACLTRNWKWKSNFGENKVVDIKMKEETSKYEKSWRKMTVEGNKRVKATFIWKKIKLINDTWRIEKTRIIYIYINMKFQCSYCCEVASVVSDSVWPHMIACQAFPSLGFSRQEHWSGLPFPSPVHESEKWKWSRSVVSDS